PLAKSGEDDKLVRQIRQLQFVAGRLADARDEADALTALQRFGQPSTTVGKLSDWNPDASGANPVRTIHSTLKVAREAIELAIEEHRTAALATLLTYLRDFTLAYARFRRQQGATTFHDLLTWARGLLRDHGEVRAQAQRRFERIFVDEFQDTDPLQAEIAWLLAAEPDVAVGTRWDAAPLVPGKLFVVGDPKQSIYRFRQADLRLYAGIYGRARDDEKVALTQNFRSVAPVLDWVNYQLGRDMIEENGVQAPYVALQPVALGVDFGDQPYGLHQIGVEIDGAAATVWSAEAGAVAGIARQAVMDGWKVRGADGRLRKARYADVCVLLPTRHNVRRLEDAFERHDVPYRIESGSLVFATQEVRDLLNCLRAIDDPSDQVALVAALRSPAYACSDVDLLRWVEDAGALDYERPRDGKIGPVADALVSLEQLHRARVDRSPAATVEALIRERLLAVQTFGQPRPREAWRRLRYVVAQARALAAAGRTTLRALVDWLEGLQRVEVRDLESPRPEQDEDAVRLLTVHRAKGLEFPIVVLTGLGARGSNANRPVRILPARDAGSVEVRCGSFQTRGYEDARQHEAQIDAAERIRLLYVAATRARDHLVLCLFRGPWKSDAARIAEGLHDLGDSACHALTLPEAPSPGLVAPGLDSFADTPDTPVPLAGTFGVPAHGSWPDSVAGNDAEGALLTPDEHAREEQRWVETRQALIAELGTVASVTATDLAQFGPAERQAESGTRTAPGALPDALPDAVRDGSEPEGQQRAGSEPASRRDASTDERVAFVVSGQPGFNSGDDDAPGEDDDAAMVSRVATASDAALASLGEDDDQPSDLEDGAEESVAPADAARRLGRAVHAVLEAGISPSNPHFDAVTENIARRLRVLARVEEVRRLVRAVSDNPLVREAIASGRLWREVDVGCAVDGVVLEGRIDLLCERADGSLAIVDFKTDRVDRQTVAARAEDYRLQVGAYALAAEQATHKRVSSVEIVFASLDGHTEAFSNIPALIEDVRAALTAVRTPTDVAGWDVMGLGGKPTTSHLATTITDPAGNPSAGGSSP
ncbi:MAG TPA: 3'-5' exonuclease, partial [Chloroflexota bacterium]|nr:3'-5' exonuclease [Chloroflexota bacterium]